MAGLTAAKAKKILSDGTVNGKPLTAKQKAYFGLIAGGGKPSTGKDKKDVSTLGGKMHPVYEVLKREKKKKKKMTHNPYHKKDV